MNSTTNTEALLNLAMRLRQRHARPPRFNVFTTLHKSTDEVRLHSRFIAALLNPRAHELDRALLALFIEQVGIPAFSLDGVRVATEHQRIDILITNTQRQAILIENKLLAADQEKQLVTYYQALRAQGYREVYVVFMSLDGRPPAAHSLGDLKTLGTLERPGSYHSLAYAEDLLPWLSRCAEKAVLHPPLRESIVQYHDLISQLTGQNMDTTNQDMLAETLLEGNNLVAAHDIRLAFDEALIRLQEQLWLELKERIAIASPEMARRLDGQSSTDGNLREQCRALMRPTDRKSVGLYYCVPNVPGAFVAAEIEDSSIYLGVKCPVAQEGYSALCEQLDSDGRRASRNHLWAAYAYHPWKMNLRTPSAETLRTLTNKQERHSLVQAMADEMLRQWYLVSAVEPAH